MTAGAADFWPPVSADPVVDELYRVCRYRGDRLPATALEFLDRLRQIGYRIGELEDLDLQDPDGLGGVELLDRDRDKAVAVDVGQRVDGLLDVGVSAGAGHVDSSSQRDRGAVTPRLATIEEATDMVAGSSRGASQPRLDPPFRGAAGGGGATAADVFRGMLRDEIAANVELMRAQDKMLGEGRRQGHADCVQELNRRRAEFPLDGTFSEDYAAGWRDAVEHLANWLPVRREYAPVIHYPAAGGDAP